MQAVAREKYCNRLQEISNVTLKIVALLRITERCAVDPQYGNYRPSQITYMIELWQKALVRDKYLLPPPPPKIIYIYILNCDDFEFLHRSKSTSVAGRFHAHNIPTHGGLQMKTIVRHYGKNYSN